MADSNFKKQDEIQVLESIAKKTKAYQDIYFQQTSFIMLELLCYLLFLFFIACIILLPDYVALKITNAEDEIGFYILDEEEKESWSNVLRITLAFFSLLPLLTALAFRRLRIKNRLLNEVFSLANNTVA
jgi:hypothetical protein